MLNQMVAILIAQATVVSAPTTDGQAAGTAWARSVKASSPVPSGTVDKPTLVADAAIRTPEGTVRQGRQAQESAARDRVTTHVPSIASIASPDCHKVAEHPYGHQLESDSTLNGRATIFQCNNFVVHVGVRDFRQALKVGTAGGFPQSAQKAVLNGGALTYWYRQSSSGIRQAVFVWVGKMHTIEVGLDSREASLAALSTAGTSIVGGLTRGR